MEFKNVVEADIKEVAKAILNTKIPIVLFIGEVGAGKTSLIKTICSLLHVTDLVSSPTFALLNEYDIPNTSNIILHADFYRINEISELYEAGIMEYFEKPFSIFCIEWPQIALPYLPKPYLTVHIKKTESTRSYTIKEEY